MSGEQKKKEGQLEIPYRLVIAVLQLQVAFKDLLVTGQDKLALVGVEESMRTLSPLVERWARDRLKQKGIIPTSHEIQQEVALLMNKRFAPFLETQHGNNEGKKK